jgi:hypothetical protein
MGGGTQGSVLSVNEPKKTVAPSVQARSKAIAPVTRYEGLVR